MRRDRARGLAALVAALLFVGACGSGGAAGSIGASRTPEGPPIADSPGITLGPASAAVAGTLPPGALTIATLGDSLTEDAATLYTDGNHPNEAGYDRIAAIWLAAIKPLL